MPSATFFPRWSTSAIADAADTSPMALSELGDHVSRCRDSGGRWFALRCGADAFHEFVAARFITSVVVIGGVIALVAAAL